MDNKKTFGIKVYLELKSYRLFVGTLTKKENLFHFEYEKSYLNNRHAIPLGPEMPLTRPVYRSGELFIPFADRIPSRENPAYPEYCQATGINIDEKDSFIILSTIAHRGPSSFIFEPLFEDVFTSKDLLAFRKALGLTVKEFATCFEFSPAAITRIELGQSSGREVLKRVEIYAHYPEVALNQLRSHGSILHTNKQRNIEKFFKEAVSSMK